MPIILKGVQRVEDVIRAIEVGVQGVVLLGGYDVVAKPLAEQAVLQTLQRAMYYRKTEPRSPKT